MNRGCWTKSVATLRRAASARLLVTVPMAAAVLSIALSVQASAIVLGNDEPVLARQAVMVLGDKGSFCTGVVIAPTIVLTAGHCIHGASSWRVHYRDATGAPVMLEPRSVAIHPGFNAGSVQNRQRSIDMALVRLANPLPPAFQPARLAPAIGDGKPQSLAGQRLSVAGFGVAQERAPTTGGRFRTAELGVVEPYGPSRILVWLADSRKPGAGACQGDSGGPIFAQDGAVAAITVWAEGVGKASCGALTQGLLVGPQRQWIDGIVAGWQK